MDYSTYVSAVAVQLGGIPITTPASATPSSDANFNTLLPRAIEYAELKMYQDPDLDFLSCKVVDSSVSCAPASRNITPPPTLIVIDRLNIITPAATAPDAGIRNPTTRVTDVYLDWVWPGNGAAGVPVQWALETATKIIVGPTPDAAYKCEFVGTYRPETLSPSNPDTWLATNLPDIFFAATMIYWSGYQRNFGAQSEDPQMSLSWQKIYDDRKREASTEEARKKAQSADWGPYPPTVIAVPARGQ